MNDVTIAGVVDRFFYQNDPEIVLILLKSDADGQFLYLRLEFPIFRKNSRDSIRLTKPGDSITIVVNTKQTILKNFKNHTIEALSFD
jgi:hypothetical protein